MITQLFIPIFNFLGIDIILLPLSELISKIATTSNWFNLLSPDIIISWLIYFMFAYGTIFVLLVIPFRYFKKLIKVPKRKW